MKIIKILNNNVVLAKNDAGKELVAFGKGIGFGKKTNDDIEQGAIQKSYIFDDNKKITKLINTIPAQIIEVTQLIIALGQKEIRTNLSPTILLSLCDHLNFAIERYKNDLFIKSPLHWEIKHLYPAEYKFGLDAVKLINAKLDVDMPSSEASFIALYFINSNNITVNRSFIEVTRVISKIVEFITDDLSKKIDKSSVEFSRFITHLRYFILRYQAKQKYQVTDSDSLFTILKDNFPENYEIAEKIRLFLIENYGLNFDKNESICLMIHLEKLNLNKD